MNSEPESHPSWNSQLRELVTEWSKPDHKYNAYIAQYKLSNLIAELQLVCPEEIHFGDLKKGDSFLRRFTNYCKNLVESWSGESWDWWPLSPPSRCLGKSEERMWWKCVSVSCACYPLG